jgi:tetratricopeptide (TPR) repeat protein
MDAKQKIEHLRLICQGAPDDHLSFYMLGLELGKTGEYIESARALARCVELKPDYTAAYRHWGDALRKAGDREQEAIAIYEKGIQVSEETGDLQAGKEMKIFLDQLKKKQA